MNAQEDNADKLVCVTGASGYIGGHVVKLLLEKGYRVRGVVRNLKNKDKYDFLFKFPQKNGQLEFVEADLQAGNYEDCLKGCVGLIHTATPYIYTANDPEKEIVQPAVDGTVSALNAAIKAGVKRVVVTSSGGAFLGVPVEPNYEFTTKDWNTWSSLQNNPYFYSKRLAEQAAWKIYEENKQSGNFELVVVNPLFVIGPPQTAVLNQSLTTVRNNLMGEAKSINPGRVGWVDVRDVATAHVIAFEHKDAAGQRLFCCSEIQLWKTLNDKMRQMFPEYPVTQGDVPDTPIFSIDTKPLQALGMPPFRSFDTMVRDTVEAFIQLGVVPDLKKKPNNTNNCRLCSCA